MMVEGSVIQEMIVIISSSPTHTHAHTHTHTHTHTHSQIYSQTVSHEPQGRWSALPKIAYNKNTGRGNRIT